MDKARPVVHFEIRGRDAKRLQEFYATIFGWQVDTNNPIGYGFVAAGEGGPPEGIGGGIAESDTPLVMVYVQVVSLDETLKKVEELGGKTVTPPTDVPGSPTIAHFQDPEGNVMGLVKQ